MDGASGASWRVRVVCIIRAFAVASAGATVSCQNEVLADCSSRRNPWTVDGAGRQVNKWCAASACGVFVRDDQGLHTARLHRNHAASNAGRIRRIEYFSGGSGDGGGIREVAVREQRKNTGEEDWQFPACNSDRDHGIHTEG